MIDLEEAVAHTVSLYPKPEDLCKAPKNRSRDFWKIVGRNVWVTVHQEFSEEPKYVRFEVARFAVCTIYRNAYGKKAAFGKDEIFTYVILPDLEMKRDYLCDIVRNGLGDRPPRGYGC